MTPRALFLVLFLAAFAHAQTFLPPGPALAPPAAAPVTAKTFYSSNGKFRLTLEDPTSPEVPRTLSATISNIETGAPVLRWVTEFQAIPIRYLHDHQVIVSDDGAFFLCAENARDWTIFRQNKRPLSLVTSADLYQSRPVNSAEKIVEIDHLNNEPFVRLWDNRRDRWTAYYIHRDVSIEVTENLAARWNEATRQKILDALNRARLDLMRQKLATVSERLSDLAKTAITPTNPADIREVHYEFLAHRRHPEDRIWFERLLSEATSASAPNPTPPYFLIRKVNGAIQTIPAPSQFSHLESTSYARARGDWLLAIFDKKDLQKIPEHDRPLFYLGAASGTVKLPAPILNRAGKIRIYLAPESRGAKNPTASETIEATLDNQLLHFALTDEITFKFGSIAPGNYILKAIWDKRPGFDDRQKPGPGDYESAWSTPITITAGASITNLLLECTNRASAGHEYYAADAKVFEKWKEANPSPQAQ